ncbi:MAG: hypothetical protein HY958_12830 [Bacteroidia bacterium]|nr:hypothetical protein [Bacteroidia bacterium]
MKRILFSLSAIVLIFSLLFTLSCKKKSEETKSNIVPSTFKVDVPSAINSATATGSKSIETDTLSGNVIYANLRTFIHVGCVAADAVNTIMVAIYTHNINQAMTFDYVSNEDQRTKHVVVIEGASFGGTSYQFKMTITDQGSNAIQVFWNTNPIKGVAILNPYNINKNWGATYASTMYMVEYSEAGENSYQKQMTVSIANFPLIPGNTNSINNLKMFVGKNGNQLTLWGNSNHPNATIINPAQVGKDYAFVAHSDAGLNIGVAKVGITPTDHTTTTDIFTTYAVKNVIDEDFYAVYGVHLPNSFLANAEAPAYFVAPQGYVSCGTSIPNNSGFTSTFNNLDGLTPYIPNDVKNLTLSFQ